MSKLKFKEVPIETRHGETIYMRLPVVERGPIKIWTPEDSLKELGQRNEKSKRLMTEEERWMAANRIHRGTKE